MRTLLIRATACLTMLILTTPAPTESFVVPFDSQLFLRPVGGEAGADTEFGIARSMTDLTPIFTGLPNNPNPNTEVLVGLFTAGQVVDFYERSTFGGLEGVAFSFDTTTEPSRVAFMDLDDSLGLGGRVIEQTSPTTWLMHLDDAVSYLFDDDDNDVLIQIRLEATVTGGPVPEPSSLVLGGTGALVMAGYAWRRRKRGKNRGDQDLQA
jgi:hypothetical protein